MIVHVLFFGLIRDITAKPFADFELSEAATLETLRHKLYERFPKLKNQTTFKYAVNNEYCLDEKQQLKQGDEIALIPPVSGG